MSNEIEESALYHHPADLTATERRQGYKLSGPELLFVLEYLVDFNPGRAFDTIYASRGGDPLTHGRRLLSHPRIAAAVAAEVSEQGKHLFLKKEAIVARAWAEATDMTVKQSARIRALALCAQLTGAVHQTPEDRAMPSISIHVTDNHGVIAQQRLPDGTSSSQRMTLIGETEIIEPVEVPRGDGKKE